MWTHAKFLGATVAATALLVAGCGESGPKLGRVSGKVTLDGQPLAGAMVEFHPSEGRGSIGVTDAQGNYDLSFTEDRMGAIVGQHTVRIAMADEEDDSRAAGKIPARYNSQSELTAEVQSGSNEVNFDLQSN